MKITALVRGKKSKRINVFLDDEFAFSVEEVTLVKENLFKGKEIYKDEIDRITSKDLVLKFTFKVIELLGRRPRSKFEIEQYLKRKLSDPRYDTSKETIKNTIDEVISTLSGKNYLNDEEFARWWIKGRQEFKPRGKSVLKKELFSKGVDKEIINSLLSEMVDSEVEFDEAMKIGEKKYNSLKLREKDKYKLKAKVSAFLYGKGYDWEIISKVIKELII